MPYLKTVGFRHVAEDGTADSSKKEKKTSYKWFCDEMFKNPNEHVYVQPHYENNKKVSAVCVSMNRGVVIAVWVHRKGIVWQR